MANERCPCGAECDSLGNGYRLCRNAEHPHLWAGIGGVTDPAIVWLVAALRAENAKLREALEKLSAEVKRHDEHNSDHRAYYACGWDFDGELKTADAALAVKPEGTR